MEPIETFEVDEKTRIATYCDNDAENPLTWGDHVTKDSPEYVQWASGDVYGVAIETRIDFYELDDNGIATDRPAIEVWEETDSLWGCYLDGEYTALVVAKENFGVKIGTGKTTTPEQGV